MSQSGKTSSLLLTIRQYSTKSMTSLVANNGRREIDDVSDRRGRSQGQQQGLTKSGVIVVGNNVYVIKPETRPAS